MKKLKVRQLEAFQAVMLVGSVTGGANRLGISQPAVSQLLRQLEEACGFKLFNSAAGKIVPTRDAEALHLEVNRLFVGVDRIQRVATALREQSWGSLRIAAFPAIARRLIPEMVMAYRKDHQEVSFHVQSMRSRSVIDAVAAQHADIGICSVPGDRPEVESVYVETMKAICIVPANHPLAEADVVHPQDLEQESFVSLGFQDNSKSIVDQVFTRLNVTRNIQLECGQSDVVFSFVACAAGVSIVDPLCVYNASGFADTRVKMVQFSYPIDFGVWLIRPKTRKSFKLLENFEAFAVSQLASRIVELNIQSQGPH